MEPEIEEIFKNFPVLETNRLNLVEIKSEHLEDIFNLFGDSAVTQFYNLKTLKEIQEGQKLLDWFETRYKARLGIRWGISLKGQHQIIGTVGFNNFTIKHRATIGYDLQCTYWNQGLITEALESIINFGFTKLNVHRIEAEVMVGNLNSEKVLDKLGFTMEGVLRDWMYWDSKYFDMIMYSLLKSDCKENFKLR